MLGRAVLRIIRASSPCFHFCSRKCEISSPGNVESESGSAASPWVGQLNVLTQVIFLLACSFFVTPWCFMLSSTSLKMQEAKSFCNVHLNSLIPVGC